MNKTLIKHFEVYQKARRDFVQIIAESALKIDNLPILMELNVLSLLRPLLLDKVPAIQQVAALSISRLANFSKKNAEEIVESGMLPDIVLGLKSIDPHFQKYSCQIIKSVSKHSIQLTNQVINCGCIPHLIGCLKSEDFTVKEYSISALCAISSHSAQHAQQIVDNSSLPFIINSLQIDNIKLKRVCITAIGSISSHSLALTKSIIESKAIPSISLQLKNKDSKLLEETCLTLSQIAKHSVDTAELVVESDIIPIILNLLIDSDINVRYSASNLILQIVQHTQELSQVVSTFGSSSPLVKYLKLGTNPIPTLKAIGYMSSFSSQITNTLLDHGAGLICLNIFATSKSDDIKSIAAWTLGQLGKHSSDTSSSLTSINVLSLLLEGHNELDGSELLKNNIKEALKLIIENCEDIEALQPLISKSPEYILRKVLTQISKLLEIDPKVRAPFVSSGSFRAVQQIKAEQNSKLKKIIDAINDSYPDQTVRFYSPNYQETLKKEIEEFKK